MNLQDLNVYCLESTMKLLPLEHQIKVSCVSLLMKDIISSIWIRKYLRHGKLSLTDSTMTPKSIAGFAAVMCEHTEELIVSDAAVLFILTMFKWPKLRHLEAYVESGDKTAKIQFLDEQFPALESLDLTWGVIGVNNFSPDKITVPFAEEVHYTICLIHKISIYEMKLLTAPWSPMRAHFVRKIRELKSQHQEILVNATQKNKLLQGIKLKCLRKLKLNMLSVKSLCLGHLPQLQELHFQSPNQTSPFFEEMSLSNFLAHCAECVKTQVLDKTRHMPLTLHCSYMHDNVRPACETADTEILRMTWIKLPRPIFDPMFYFG